jgi:hypothetical protein
VIVRRERPHPGAQLTLFEARDGWRYTAFITNTTTGQLQWLEARHRAHARVGDWIRCAKGLDKIRLEHNAAAAAVNLIRLDAWWTGKPLDRTRTTHLQRLDLTLAA